MLFTRSERPKRSTYREVSVFVLLTVISNADNEAPDDHEGPRYLISPELHDIAKVDSWNS
jgi:hypothetical protein